MTALSPITGPLERIRTRALTLGRWLSGGVAFLLGALGAASHAPLFFWPLLLISITGFVWLLDAAAEHERPARSAAWRGWAYGFGYFLGGLWWVGNAFAVAGAASWQAPIAILALPAGLGLLWACAAAIAIKFWSPTWRRVIVVAVVFSLVEYARGHIISGFPWNLAGHVWPAGGVVSQAAAWVGAYGLTALTWFAFAAPAALAGPVDRPGARAAPMVIAIALFAAISGAGFHRLVTDDAAPLEDVRLRIVQAQIDQKEKWRPENRDAVRARYLALTRTNGLDTRTHVIWPESALPIFLLEEPRTLDAISNTLLDGQVLMTGAVRRDVSNPLHPIYFNSMVAFSMDGRTPVVAAIYDKRKLVPFGEFLPFPNLMKSLGVDKILSVDDGFTPGPGPTTVIAPGAPNVSPQICYEVVFPGYTPRGSERPGWILNVSNDAWYGDTTGPRQHFNQARYRAIEEGVPVVRAASGGVSAVVDAYGRSVGHLPLTAEDVLDVSLPSALPPTVYALIGDAGFWVIIVALGGSGLIGRSRRNTSP